LRWEERAEELELRSLEFVRSAAEKWAASLAAILALFGTVLVVKGGDDISRLSSGYKVAVAVLLLLGFAAASYATWQAALAAQGTPEELQWPTGPNLRRWERDRALSAKRQLRRSRLVTWLAVIFLVFAVGLTWFGESASTAHANSLSVTARRAMNGQQSDRGRADTNRYHGAGAPRAPALRR
jgi:hypothetical protein